MKKFNLFFVFIAIFTFMGCSKDYLDSNPTSEVSSNKLEEILVKNPDAYNSLLLGIYSAMYTPGSGGTSDDDDFGQKGFDIFTDLLSSDMVLGGTNYYWYVGLASCQATLDFTTVENYKPWRYYYRIVFSANKVIDALGGNDAVLKTDIGKHIMGQAKAMRGYAYFYLAQLYQKSYNAEELILPIYIDLKAANQPKSKASDVYALIIKDLTDAIGLLETFNRPDKNSVNKPVAQGLLAYAYGAQGNYAKVAEITSAVIAQGGFPLTQASALAANLDPVNGKLLNSESGFNDVKTPSWMWGMDLTAANKLGVASWWGHADYYTYSYAWAGDPKLIDKGLFDKITATDTRKKQFDDATGAPLYKFFDPKRVIGGQSVITTDYIYMRIEEMYLLNAEAKAKLGDDSGARARLKELLEIRNVDLAYLDGLSGTSLQNEIYLQTRIEFWGEGKSYLAMKRNKATITRGSNHLFLEGESIPYNDARLTFRIPQNEVLNNPFID